MVKQLSVHQRLQQLYSLRRCPFHAAAATKSLSSSSHLRTFFLAHRRTLSCPSSLSVSSICISRSFSSHRERGSSLVQVDSRLSPEEQAAFLAQITQPYIRNFSIIAHIDHGKSTLADRLLETAGNIAKLEKEEAQILDKLQVERERGITVKAQTASIFYRHQADPTNPNTQSYLLNLIDTPGHVDFSYEVSRSLSACQGALLLVDAAQGIQAQTLANYHTAKNAGLDIIPVITKIDLPHADIKAVSEQMQQAFGVEIQDIITISSKTGENIHNIFPAIVQRVRPPTGVSSTLPASTTITTIPTSPSSAVETEAPSPVLSLDVPLRARLFDSWYELHRGVVCLLCIVDGHLSVGDKVATYHQNHQYEVQEIGLLMPHNHPVTTLQTGQVGYMIAAIRSTKEAQLGDTIYRLATKKHRGTVSQQLWQSLRSNISPLPGFAAAKSMVFAGLFPASQSDFESLSDAMEKLTLNDASVHMQKESSGALGLGYRCGFLGVLHMDVFVSRLEQEFGASVIITAPTVPYIAVMKADESEVLIDSPSTFPVGPLISHYLEPIVLATIITPTQYQGPIMELCATHRGTLLELLPLDTTRISLRYHLPLSEIIIDFYDSIKTLSSGYASFDYVTTMHDLADLCKLEVRINGEAVDALSCIVHVEQSDSIARKLVVKLRETIDRTHFDIIIQACIGNKIIARERIAPYRKDVLSKSGKTVGGGDVTRKKKLLEKQKEGRKKLRMIGEVELNEKVFTAVMKLS